MSSTRHAPAEAPLNQERYMSSPEFAELRGISGTAAAAKAALLDDPAKRSLLLFLQSVWHRGIAAEILETVPEFIGTPTMRKIGMKAGQVYNADQVRVIRDELGCKPALFPLRGEPDCPKPDPMAYFFFNRREDFAPEDDLEYKRDFELYQASVAKAAKAAQSYPATAFVDYCRARTLAELPGFLVDLCINPRVLIASRSSASGTDSEAIEAVMDYLSEIQKDDIKPAAFRYLFDPIGALLEYQRRYASRAREQFVETTVSRKVWSALDKALKSRRIQLVDGLEGRGKTEAVKAWCKMHRGEARYVSLSGITGQTNVFKEISRALGIASTYSRKANEMQQRINDTLRRSGLLLVIDEAHWLFDPRPRMSSRPALVDWINTDLYNHGVRVALICTPQFMQSANQAVRQVGWNIRQFIRRTEYALLPEKNTKADLEAAARHLAPKLSAEGIKLMVGYALLSKRDMSGLGDVIEEARLGARADDRDAITFADVERAINGTLIPSDKAFAERVEINRASNRQRGPRSTEPAGDLLPDEEITATPLRSPGRDAAALLQEPLRTDLPSPRRGGLGHDRSASGMRVPEADTAPV